jgi:hypothetical protein
VNLKVEDYYPSGKRLLLRFKEKGGKEKELPVHHKLEELLDEYSDRSRQRARLSFVSGRLGQNLETNPAPQYWRLGWQVQRELSAEQVSIAKAIRNRVILLGVQTVPYGLSVYKLLKGFPARLSRLLAIRPHHRTGFSNPCLVLDRSAGEWLAPASLHTDPGPAPRRMPRRPAARPRRAQCWGQYEQYVGTLLPSLIKLVRFFSISQRFIKFPLDFVGVSAILVGGCVIWI